MSKKKKYVSIEEIVNNDWYIVILLVVGLINILQFDWIGGVIGTWIVMIGLGVLNRKLQND